MFQKKVEIYDNTTSLKLFVEIKITAFKKYKQN